MLVNKAGVLLLVALAVHTVVSTESSAADAVVQEATNPLSTQQLVEMTLSEYAADQAVKKEAVVRPTPVIKAKKAENNVPAPAQRAPAPKSGAALPVMPPPVRVMDAEMLGMKLEGQAKLPKEFPREAEKLKLLSSSIAAGVSGGGGEEEVTSDSSIPTVNLWVFTIIISFLIGCTIMFEVGKHELVHMVKGKAHEPIVLAIFSELTVLGFLALVTFLLGQIGLGGASSTFFGSTEEEKILLGEMLEDIHMVIFCVMIVVVGQTLGMMFMSEKESDKWQASEDRVLTPYQRQSLAEKWSEANLEANIPSEFDRFFGLSPEAKAYSLMEKDVRFMLMRQEFINDENENPALPSLRRDFSFYLYLSKVTGHRLAEVIELGIKAWIGLLATCLLFIAVNLMALGSWQFFYGFWIFWSWGLLLAAHLFRDGLLRTLKRICHSCDGVSIMKSLEVVNSPPVQLKAKAGIKEDFLEAVTAREGKQDDEPSTTEEGSGTGTGAGAESASAAEGVASSEEGLLPSSGTSEGLDSTAVNVSDYGSTSASGGRKWINTRPRYLDDESLDKPMTPWWLARFTEKHEIDDVEKRRFYNLFYFGKHEVEFQLFVIRSFFLAIAVYISVFLLHVLPDYIFPAYGFMSAFIMSAFGLAPPLIVYFSYIYEIIQLSVMVTSVEHFRARRAVDAVQRVQKEKRCIMLLRVIIALTEESDPEDEKRLAENSRDRPQSKEKDMEQPDVSLELEGMVTIFDSLDKDGSGSLNKDELNELFNNFGFDLTATSPNGEDPIDIAFGDLISDGSITRDEFLSFMREKSIKARGYSSHHITEFCFKKWDVDESGEMTVDEFQDGLSTLGESFLPSEVSNIVIELDVNGDGEFDRHEFSAWLEKYA